MAQIKSINGRGRGTLLRVSTKDNERILGGSWMKGRLLDGDVVVCLLVPEADALCRYQLVYVGPVVPGREPGYQLLPGTEFMSLGLGEKLLTQPSEDEAGRLLAGQVVTIGEKQPPPPTFRWKHSTTTLRQVALVSEGDRHVMVGYIEPLGEEGWWIGCLVVDRLIHTIPHLCKLDEVTRYVEDHARVCFKGLVVEG